MAAAMKPNLHPPVPVDPPPSVAAVAPPPDPRVAPFCEILARLPPSDVESALRKSGLSPSPEVVESVLRLSYSFPSSAIVFFRWSGLSVKHTPAAWNLMVDILGRGGEFNAMWDAIRSMRHEPGTISVATFASAFSAYCAANRFKEAVMTFEVMERYGVAPNVVALNSLLSAICRQDGCTSNAAEFFDRVKSRVAPDEDTFAILLEGWEKEGNVQRAKSTFGEMVVRVGWHVQNMPAYDAFLTTLVRGDQADEALKFLQVMKGKNCLPGLKFFTNALDLLVRKRDHIHALSFWYVMVCDSGIIPNLIMYNAMITLCCDLLDLDSAFRLLDEMPFNGVFPDAHAYQTIFSGLVRSRRVREAAAFLAEMRKNEQLPSPSTCAAAIRLFFEEFNPLAAFDVWNCVIEEGLSSAEDCANELLVGLADYGRLADVKKYAEEILDMGIVLQLSTLDRLKRDFDKAGQSESYDRMVRRVKRKLSD